RINRIGRQGRAQGYERENQGEELSKLFHKNWSGFVLRPFNDRLPRPYAMPRGGLTDISTVRSFWQEIKPVSYPVAPPGAVRTRFAGQMCLVAARCLGGDTATRRIRDQDRLSSKTQRFHTARLRPVLAGQTPPPI